jgi:hypothetical protein
MKGKSKNLMANLCGKFKYFNYLGLIFFNSHVFGAEGYICENTITKNGMLDAFSKDQFIQKPVGQDINWIQIFNNSSESGLNKNTWYLINNGKKRSVNLNKLSRYLKFSNPKLLLRYNHKNLRELEISPILLEQKNSIYPKAQIELINPNLPVHRTWRLPKNTRAITNADYYIEYSEKYFFPTRVINHIKSAFVQNTLSCKRVFDKTRKSSFKKSRAKDITLLPQSWPSSLNLLKESIHLELVNKFLNDQISKKDLNKYEAFLKTINLTRVLKNNYIQPSLITQTKLNELSSIIKSKTSIGNLTYISKEQINEDAIIADIKIDNSKLSSEKNSFNVEDYINKKIIEGVYITHNRVSKKISFNFYSSKYEKIIKVGPLFMTDIYWKNSETRLSACSMNLMKHLSEYERKSFIFKRSQNETPNLSNILYEKENSKLPLDTFIITNNCRGPGNIEFEWPGIIKAYFHIPLRTMKKLVNLERAYVEDRMTKFYSGEKLFTVGQSSIKDYFVAMWSKYFEEEYQWKSLGSFEKVSTQCSSKILEKDLLPKMKSPTEHNITYDMGRIEYDQFPTETRRKSGYNNIKTPLVYVKTPCNDEEASKAPPKHFYPPKPYYTTNSLKYWQKKTCSIVPINFFHYKDLLDYEVHLSKFEVDGVYVGDNREDSPTETTDFDQVLLKNDKVRVPYNFERVYSFEKSSISKSQDGKFFNLSLKSKDLNFIIANISIDKLKRKSSSEKFSSEFRPWATDNVKGIYKLVGIRPFDLSNEFKGTTVTTDNLYSIFYDNQNKVLNHHDTDIGVEQWFLRYHDEEIILDLISHERITPVARIKISYKL